MMQSVPTPAAVEPALPVPELDALLTPLTTSFASGKTRDIEWRKGQLKALKTLLQQEEETLQAALQADLGKSAVESWATEIGFMLGDIKHTVKHLKRWAKLRKVATPLVAQPAQSYVLPEPLGCVLVLGAWNYPLQLSLAPCIAALAAGNCVVLKPSELAPATSAALKKLIPRYLDNGAIAVIEGGKAISSDLLARRWDHIFYTGGEAVGKIVMRAAAQHLTPVTLELGGKSPCLVDRSADIAITARRIVWGKWLNCGQTCVAPDYVIVEECVKDALLKAIKAEIRAQYGKQPLHSADYGNIVNARHLARLQGYLADQNVWLGGEVDETRPAMAPTVVLDPSLDAPLMQEEIFGPILPIIGTCRISDSLALINARPKPLALYLFCADSKVQQQVLNQTSAGSVCVNDTMLFMTNPDLPFGGVGNSGMGRYHGQAGFDNLSHLKAVMHRRFWPDIKLRYAPFSQLKQALLRKIL